ncbi:hypothetical protein CBS147323_2346 [Aspergillus niger]|nr:hypothetical protein CBS147323_2346 [Aspergillus niger]KAI3024945.1 hypothetical protein CBS147347_5915 [Aspergillus niger]
MIRSGTFLDAWGAYASQTRSGKGSREMEKATENQIVEHETFETGRKAGRTVFNFVPLVRSTINLPPSSAVSIIRLQSTPRNTSLALVPARQCPSGIPLHRGRSFARA